jgi:hypothetical protein
MRSGRLLVAATAVGVFAFTGAPSAVAEPVATCTSEVVDGVEVDYCVGNPNANTVTGVPGVNVDFEFNVGIGFGF